MEASEKVKVLQAVCAGALADAFLRMGREGVLDIAVRGRKSRDGTRPEA